MLIHSDVTAPQEIADRSGHRVERINLSEQTDVMDLFGCDLPCEGEGGFEWRDGPLLRALREGCWVGAKAAQGFGGVYVCTHL